MTDLLGNSNDDIDFDAAASAFPDISLDGEGDIPALPATTGVGAAAPEGFDDFEFGGGDIGREVKVTGDSDDEIEKFEDQFPDIGPVEEPPVQQPLFGVASPNTPFAPRPQQSALASTPVLNAQINEEESQAIRDWRERQAEEIKKRDEESKAKRQETIAKAERAIDSIYEDYNRKKERNIKENKESEAEYVSSLTDALSKGTTWDRICELVELQNSQSKTLARAGPGTTELARYKEVLLRLRREGTSAPGAAGY
ncbi:uncharacterized protein STEHIDRAFT_125616 [Stereum hirsutum FP-91666 SS1]|uniref:uncharacterized protein n=1 Tax=Stereum hirsutum (strain FP-91666) TaxID=721885 RepID=UPI000444A26C|nr:uncharacterized protein STEHIDRAFT_125616 [Stereum hirsutum FP-91666 SS1]EIM80558.1 hypothetical protein STEHIDRAFT_125616 [Stereum hirsutum FP-91666 SS1]